METVKFVVRKERGVREMSQTAEAGLFAAAKWIVELLGVPRLSDAPRLEERLAGFKDRFEVSLRLEMEDLSALKAASSISTALANAATIINGADGRVVGRHNYVELKKVAKKVRKKAHRLPRREGHRVLAVFDAIGWAAKQGIKSGRVGAMKLLSITSKIRAIQRAPLQLRLPASA